MTFDLSPLLRSSVGFDAFDKMFDNPNPKLVLFDCRFDNFKSLVKSNKSF